MSWPPGAGKCEPTPQTLALMDEAAAKARNAVIEECAKVADGRAARLRAKAKSLTGPTTQSYFAQSIEARVIADAIRALAVSRPEGKCEHGGPKDACTICHMWSQASSQHSHPKGD